jgi:hypothetical protein
VGDFINPLVMKLGVRERADLVTKYRSYGESGVSNDVHVESDADGRR